MAKVDLTSYRPCPSQEKRVDYRKDMRIDRLEGKKTRSSKYIYVQFVTLHHLPGESDTTQGHKHAILILQNIKAILFITFLHVLSINLLSGTDKKFHLGQVYIAKKNIIGEKRAGKKLFFTESHDF